MKNYLFAIVCALTVIPENVEAQEIKNPTSIEYHYEDIENFRVLLKVVGQGGDTLQAINDYFENGSEGMRAWIQRYGVKPRTMHSALKYFPSYYDHLSTLDSVLRSYEDRISKGLIGLKKLYPSEFIHIPPVYYFILFAGGGSVEMTANMISLDYFGLHDRLDRSEFDRIGGIFPEGKLPLVNVEQVPQVAIHETAHLLQSYMQGEHNYTSIYLDREKQTLLAYAIREGSADFLTYLGANIVDSTKLAYVEKYEKELWENLQPILNDHIDAHPGWFSGKSENHPDWPFQIGYSMGFKIVEHYYVNCDDKEAALLHIFNSHKEEDFQKFIELYRKKWEK